MTARGAAHVHDAGELHHAERSRGVFVRCASALVHDQILHHQHTAAREI